MSMLRRGGKGGYKPYSSSQRVKKTDAKAKDQLDILPNKPNVWLKQVSVFPPYVPYGMLSELSQTLLL